MARLAVTVTVFLFIITLTHARVAFDTFQADLTENHVGRHDLPFETTESDPKTTNDADTKTLFLPSDKPEDAEVKHAVNEQELEKTESDSSETKATTSFEPITVINFRPINRQFRQHPSLIFRHRRPCRHHALRKLWGQAGRPSFDNREVSYGNDMLTASDVDNSKIERLRWYRGDGKVRFHQIPARWVNFRDGNGPKFPSGHKDDVTVMKKMEEEEFKRPGHDFHGLHRHRHRHRHHHQHHEDGFLMKIRKFLTHF